MPVKLMNRFFRFFKMENARTFFHSFGLFLISIIPWASPIVVYAQSGTLTYPLFQNDQMHYIARAAAGWHNRNLIDVFSSASYYDSDGLFYPLEYMIFFLLSPLKYLGLSFQLVFLLFLLLSFFISIIVISKVISQLVDSKILASVIVCLFVFSDVFEKYLSIQKEPLQFSRWPFPSFHYILLFLILQFLAKKSLTRRQSLYLTLLLSLSFYTYLYTFLIAWALVLVKLLMALVRREGDSIRRIFIISVISLVFGIPYLLKQLSALSIDERIKSEAFFEAVAVQNSHSLVFSKSTIVLLIICAVIFITKSADKFLLFVTLAALSGAIASAQNIVTGLVIQPGHLHWYWMRPFLYISVIYLVFLLLSKFLKAVYLNILVSSLLITLISLNIFVQSVFFIEEQHQKGATRSTDLIMLLNSSLAEDSVFITFDSEVSDFLVTNTKIRMSYHEFSKFYRGNDDVIRNYNRLKEIWNLEDSRHNRSRVLTLEFRELLKDMGANTVLVNLPTSKYQRTLVTDCKASAINFDSIRLYTCLDDSFQDELRKD